MVSDAIYPGVLCDREGRPYDAVLVTEKSVRKSREHRRLWILHRETGRVLPYPGGGELLELAEHDGWYRFTVEHSDAAPEAGAGEPGTTAGPATAGPATAGAGAAAAGADAVAPLRPDELGVLQRVAAVIAERKTTLPEGSYTTYLFTEGLEKIRKKTGEEAIELILAERPEEIAAEAADLLYHLTVLLEASGVGLSAALEALGSRE